jgi:hypothetical protein
VGRWDKIWKGRGMLTRYSTVDIFYFQVYWADVDEMWRC